MINNPHEILWQNDALIAVMNATLQGDLRHACCGVSIDTRTLQQGDIYFAIQGEKLDGHDYVAQAFAAGACACVVRQDFVKAHATMSGLLAVEDTLKALENLGRAARMRSKAKIIAVTGSVGKTSVKEALAHVLSLQGKTHYAEKSFNNHWGVPLTLSRLPPDADYGVFELGMNHSGEIAALVDQVRPHAAIITTIGPVHIEYLGSLEAIADAKSEIFLGLHDLREDGRIAILNHDMPLFDRVYKAAQKHAKKILTFSAQDNSNASAVLINHTPQTLEDDTQTNFISAKIFDEPISYTLPAAGSHMAQNSLAVLLGVDALGVDVKSASEALSSFQAPQGRGARQVLPWDGGTITLLDESYNANPTSMRAALDVLAQIPVQHGARKIAVVGDMKELGDFEKQYHRALAHELIAHKIDCVFCVGDAMAVCFENLPSAHQGFYTQKVEAMVEPLLSVLKAGDCVMIKGSNSMRMATLVKAIQHHSKQQHTQHSL